MIKIKRVRTIDTVVVGWRPGKPEGTVGSLILGLYDPDGELRIVGHTSAFSAKRARELVDELAPYESGERGTRGPQPLDGRPRSGVALAAARAGGGGQLRPPQRTPDPPRRKAPTLPDRP